MEWLPLLPTPLFCVSRVTVYGLSWFMFYRLDAPALVSSSEVYHRILVVVLHRNNGHILSQFSCLPCRGGLQTSFWNTWWISYSGPVHIWDTRGQCIHQYTECEYDCVLGSYHFILELHPTHTLPMRSWQSASHQTTVHIPQTQTLFNQSLKLKYSLYLCKMGMHFFQSRKTLYNRRIETATHSFTVRIEPT